MDQDSNDTTRRRCPRCKVMREIQKFYSKKDKEWVTYCVNCRRMQGFESRVSGSGGLY